MSAIASGTPTEQEPEPAKTLFTEEEVQEMVYSSASKYGANANQMFQTVKCEAKKRKIDGVVYYDATAKSDLDEESYGLAQWHLESGNHNFDGVAVTHEQAINPEYALDLMAEYFSDGKQALWSCYRKYYA